MKKHTHVTTRLDVKIPKHEACKYMWSLAARLGKSRNGTSIMWICAS